MRQAVVIFGVIIATATLVVLLKNSPPSIADGKPIDTPRLKVSVSEITTQDYPVVLRSFGKIQPEHRYRLHALVGGQVVRKSGQFKAGANVHKGDVLLEIDASDYELAVAQAKTQLANAHLNLEEEKARAEQAARDWNKRNSQDSARDFTLRKPHLNAAQEQLQAAQAALDKAQQNLARTKVIAAFDGVIESVSVQEGEVVSPNSGLGQGYATSFAEVRLPIPVSDLRFLDQESGPQITLVNTLVDPPQYWPAQYLRSEANVDAQSQQVYLVAGLAQPFDAADSRSLQPLIPGQYVQANIHGRSLKGVVVVPNEVIYQGSYVYLAGNDDDGDVLQRQPVTLEYQGAEQSVILEGVSAGDRLVRTVLGQLPSGTRLEILE